MRPVARRSLLAFVAAAPALAGCEHGINLHGKVNIPPNVSQMFSPQHPGELVVRAQIPGRSDIQVPSVILCGAAGEQVIDVRHLQEACASDDNALVSAWVIPRAAHEVSCVARPPLPRPPDTLQPSSGVAFGRTVAPLNTSAPASCRDGSISFALTLEARR